jgi:hypothetical protein
MEVTYKGWSVSSGKGDRVYIKFVGNEKEKESIGNNSLASDHGVLFYGIDKVKNLAVAISLFEHKLNESESINSIFKEEIKRLKYSEEE